MRRLDDGSEACTCLSISRDPLCVHHGDVDKVASQTPTRTLRAALETHLRWLRFHATEPHVATNEPARTSYQHAADMLQALLTEQQPTEDTSDQAKAMVANYVHLKSLNVSDAEQMLEANISEALAAAQDAVEIVQLIEARAASAALRGQGSPVSQRDDALAELAQTRRFLEAAKAALQEEKQVSQEHWGYFLMERSECGRLSVALVEIADMDLRFAETKDMHDRAVAALARPEVEP